MKSRFAKHWKSAVFWGAIAACVVLVVYWTQTVFPTLTPGDKGTWAGAIGTFFTLIGTIVLATSESRRRYHSENALARLTCWSLYPRQLQVRHALDAVAFILKDIETRELLPSEYADCAERLANLTLWNAKELTPIASLPRSAANGLITVAEDVKYVRAGLESFAAKPPADIAESVRSFVTLLNLSKQSLNQSMLVCQSAMES